MTLTSKALICVMLCAFAGSVSAQAKDASIGSTSLCGDSYLLAMAPDQISELSWQSQSALSYASPAQRTLPQLWDEAEILVASTSNVILFGSGEGAQAKRLGIKFQTLEWGEDFGSVIRNAALIAGALDVPDTISHDLKHRLHDLEERTARRGAKPKVLYLARSGGSAGPGTFVDAAITAAGGDNVIQTHGWVSPDPEIILGLKPDLVITSYFKNGYESVNAAGTRNKAVSKFIASHPHADIDGALWPCAGPRLIEAAETIASALDKLP